MPWLDEEPDWDEDDEEQQEVLRRLARSIGLALSVDDDAPYAE